MSLCAPWCCLCVVGLVVSRSLLLLQNYIPLLTGRRWIVNLSDQSGCPRSPLRNRRRHCYELVGLVRKSRYS
jgi:hypothetical protein